MIRVGFGIDVHKFVENRDLWIGGVKIPYEYGLAGHSDADVLIHAICDALLGESPYTIINVGGVDTKVHLYERANYPDYFTAPTSYNSCFYRSSKLDDYSSIPSNWK